MKTTSSSQAQAQELSLYPMASEVLARFLNQGSGCLVAQLGIDGSIQASNEAFRQLLSSGVMPTSWTDQLTAASRQRWQETFETLQAEDIPRTIPLDFQVFDRAWPYQCLIHREGDGSFWLLGLPDFRNVLLLDTHSPAERVESQAGTQPSIDSESLWLRRQAEEARREAVTDPLTGLANRRIGDRWLDSAVSEAQTKGLPLALIMIDLDHFKSLNDQFGHLVGDQVLMTLAQIMTRQLGPNDCLYRYGGDEFVWLLPEMGQSEALAQAEQLRAIIARQTHPPIHRTLNASFGLACWKPWESGQDLLLRADAALIQAKRLGRNRVELALESS